jgi:pimeloyl-ACP methyl ester carboxylesterase
MSIAKEPSGSPAGVSRAITIQSARGRSVAFLARGDPNPRGSGALFDLDSTRQTIATAAAQGNVRASPVPANFMKGSVATMSVRPGQIRAESQDGVAMIPGAIAMRHRYQELTMPVVIMAGAEDPVINAKQPGRLHAQIPHSILRLVPGVEHMSHHAVPEEVAVAIEEVGGLATKLRNTRQALLTASAA